MENEINLKLITTKVEAQPRKLKLEYNYEICMFEKDIKDSLQEIKTELKFHGFTMEIGKIKDGTVSIYNIKDDISMNLFIEDLVYYSVDEAIEYIKACVSLESITMIENAENETKEEMAEYLKTKLKFSDEEILKLLDGI